MGFFMGFIDNSEMVCFLSCYPVQCRSNDLHRGTISASEMTYIVSSGALNSTHSLTRGTIPNSP